MQTWGLGFQQMDFGGHIASTAASQLLSSLPPALVFLGLSHAFTFHGKWEAAGITATLFWCVLNSPCGDLTHILQRIYYQAY